MDQNDIELTCLVCGQTYKDSELQTNAGKCLHCGSNKWTEVISDEQS